MRLRTYLCLLILAATVRAQTLENTADHLKDLASSARTWVPYFQQQESLVLRITLGVILLGALATVTALARSDKAKWITATVAASITILTGVKSQVLHADQESFGAVAIATVRIVKDVTDHLSQYDKAVKFAIDNGQTFTEKDYYAEEFSRDLVEIQKIDERASKLNATIMTDRQSIQQPSARLRLFQLSSVYASESQEAPQPPANSYVAKGKGTCDTTFGAREYARFDGRRRIALQLEPAAPPERLDSLIAAIDNSVVDQWSNLARNPNNTHLADYTVQVTLNKVLARPAFLKVNSERRTAPSYAAVVRFKPGINGRLEVGSQRAIKGRDGAFVFAFQLSSQGENVRVQLIEIRTYDDSSPGSTRWSFDVIVGDQRLFSVPLRRLEDSGKPTTCSVLPEEALGATAKLANKLTDFTILGYKLKD